MISAQELKRFIERIERLEDQKQNVMHDISEVYHEAKNEGFDVKALKSIVRLRKMDQSKLAEMEALIEIYKEAIGML